MKFFQRVVITWFIMFAAIGAASRYGQDEVNKLAGFGIGVCAGMPCYRGIVPGQTSWDDVRTYLDGAKIAVDDGSTIAVTLADRIELELYQDAGDPPIVETIRVSDYTVVDMMPTDFPSLGHFLRMYGTPCLVIVDASDPARVHVSQLMYPTLALSLSSTEPFLPSARVRSAWIFSTNPDLCTNEFNKAAGLSWAGFATPTRYFDTMLERSVEHVGP
jgi:hypothetical protein